MSEQTLNAVFNERLQVLDVVSNTFWKRTEILSTSPARFVFYPKPRNSKIAVYSGLPGIHCESSSRGFGVCSAEVLIRRAPGEETIPSLLLFLNVNLNRRNRHGPVFCLDQLQV